MNRAPSVNHPTGPAVAPAAVRTAPVEIAAAESSRQSALVALGRRAVAASDTTLLLQDAASLAAETLDAEFSSVAELLPGGGAFNVRLSNTKGGPPLVYQTPAGEADSLAGLALGSGHPVLIDDLAAGDRVADPRLARHGVRSAIVCPLRLDDEAFGALGVYLATPNRFSPSDVLFVETISHLITTTIARDHAERRLAAERTFAATVLETVEALVLVLNPAGRLLKLNRAAEKITGFDSDEVFDRPLYGALVVPEEVELIKGVFEKLQRGEAPVAFDSSILTKHSQRRRISWSFSIQRDPRGQLTAILGTGVDVTDKCAAESLLAEARSAANQAQQQSEQLSSQLEQVRSLVLNDDAPAQGKLRPFQQLLDPAGGDRRKKPRRAYPYIQLLASMKDDRLPGRSAFKEVLCHDISASGFSFYSPTPPASDTLVVAFGTRDTYTYLKAHVVHCRRTEDGRFLVGCQYTGRVQV